MTHLSDLDRHDLCRIAITAATEAGKIIARYTPSEIVVKHKKGGTSLASQVVTEVDLLSQEAILRTLQPTVERYDLALLTEESTDDQQRLHKDYFWCIDPLDGTLPFVEGTPGYAVSIALVARDGRVEIGVVFDPTRNTLYHAIRDGGLFRNQLPWSPLSRQNPSDHLTFIADRSFKQHPLFNQTLSELRLIALQCGFKGLETILYGGAVMNACWVLEQTPACYFKYPKAEPGGGSCWDYAATSCLFIAAAAAVSDIFGEPLKLNQAATTFMHQQGILFAHDQRLARRIMRLFLNINPHASR